MKRFVAASALLVLLAAAGVAWASTRIEIDEDFEPPSWHDFQSLSLVDGELFAIQDGEWAAVFFFRPPEDIPSGFDLFHDFDEAVFDSELLVGGFVLLDDGDVPIAQVRGLGAVPVWFVPWDELQDAAADDVLTIDELAGMDSLTKGTADFFVEENHVYGSHQVSHLTTQATGTLEDGRSFEVRAVEVELELKQVRIEFE